MTNTVTLTYVATWSRQQISYGSSRRMLTLSLQNIVHSSRPNVRRESERSVFQFNSKTWHLFGFEFYSEQCTSLIIISRKKILKNHTYTAHRAVDLFIKRQWPFIVRQKCRRVVWWCLFPFKRKTVHFSILGTPLRTARCTYRFILLLDWIWIASRCAHSNSFSVAYLQWALFSSELNRKNSSNHRMMYVCFDNDCT